MNDTSSSFDLNSFLDAVKRRKKSFSIYFFIALAITLGVAWLIPSTYHANTTVLVERQISSNFVSTTITGDVQERLQVLQQRALTRDNLVKFAKDRGMLPEYDQLSPEDRVAAEDEVIEEIVDGLLVDLVDVNVTESKSGRTSNVVVSFNVAYESEVPEQAADFANEITRLLLVENRSLRSEQSEQVASFLGEAEERLRNEIHSVENELSKLSEQSYDLLPEQLSETRKEISRKQEELVLINGDIGLLETQQDQLKTRLASTPKHVISDKADSVAIQDPKVRLQQARLDLKVALQSFTEKHPDVVRLKQLISDLEKEVAAGRGSATSDLVLPSNPEHVALSQQLNDVQAKLESAKARSEQIKGLIADSESKIRANPTVELKYNQLLRDLERAQTEYADIKSRLYEAQLAQSLEREEKGEKLTLLSNAIVPRDPVAPNRIALSILGLVISLVVGASRVLVIEFGDNTVKDSKDVLAVTGGKPLAVIPVIDLTNV